MRLESGQSVRGISLAAVTHCSDATLAVLIFQGRQKGSKQVTNSENNFS